MSRLALDRGYETGAVHRGLELLGITGYIPAIQFSNPPEKYGFSYDPQLDAFICPEGVPLTYHRLNCSKSTGKYLRCYQVEGDACMRCPKRPSCFDKAGIRRRVLASSCYPAFFRGHQRVGTPEYLAMMRLRKIWAEGSFSVLKREHCISRIRKRGILAATEECLLAAMALGQGEAHINGNAVADLVATHAGTLIQDAVDGVHPARALGIVKLPDAVPVIVIIGGDAVPQDQLPKMLRDIGSVA